MAAKVLVFEDFICFINAHKLFLYLFDSISINVAEIVVTYLLEYLRLLLDLDVLVHRMSVETPLKFSGFPNRLLVVVSSRFARMGFRDVATES